MTPSHFSDHGSFIHVDGLKYDVLDRGKLFILAKGADAAQVLLCLSCPKLTSDPAHVKNFYCEGCKRFLNPTFPMGRISMTGGLETAAPMCEAAVEQYDAIRGPIGG